MKRFKVILPVVLILLGLFVATAFALVYDKADDIPMASAGVSGGVWSESGLYGRSTNIGGCTPTRGQGVHKWLKTGGSYFFQQYELDGMAVGDPVYFTVFGGAPYKDTNRTYEGPWEMKIVWVDNTGAKPITVKLDNQAWDDDSSYSCGNDWRQITTSVPEPFPGRHWEYVNIKLTKHGGQDTRYAVFTEVWLSNY